MIFNKLIHFLSDIRRLLCFSLLAVGLLSQQAIAININEVIEQSILTNPSILEQYNHKISREYEVRGVHGDFLPQIDFDTNAGVVRVDNETTRAAGSADVYQKWDTSLTLKQMLFDGYLTSSEKQRQQKRVESAFFELYNLAEETAISTINVYTNVLLYQKLAEFAEQNLVAHQKMHDQIEMRSLLGADDKSALSQSLGRLRLAQSNVLSEENNLQDRWTEYVEIAGYRPEEALEDVVFDLLLPQNYEEVLDYALANHPALARSKSDIEQFKLQKRSSKSFYYPRVELELKSSWNRKYSIDTSGQGEKTNEQYALVNLNWNLYNGGSDKARMGKDQFLRQEADEHLEWQRRRVEKDVAYAWHTYQSSEKRLSYLKEYVSATEQTSVAYLDQFKIGERTLLDLLNVQNEIFEAQKEYLTVKYENIVSKYRVLASMGILLEKLKVKVVTDEYYQGENMNQPIVNDKPQKDKAHDERELKKRDAPTYITDMRYTKMNNNLRPTSQQKEVQQKEVQQKEQLELDSQEKNAQAEAGEIKAEQSKQLDTGINTEEASQGSDVADKSVIEKK